MFSRVPFRCLSAVVPAMVCCLVPAGCRTLEDEKTGDAVFDQAAFAIADGDSDGNVTKEELARYQHREGLAEIDLDGDDRISAEEWNAARPSADQNDEQFNRLDKNRDGKIDEEEAVRFITEHVRFGEAFQKLDTDGDSRLHWEEIDEGAPGELDVTLFSLHPDS